MKVISRITSGLGNQLFQYACGLHVSSVLDAQLELDTSWFDYFQRHAVKRKYRLDRLNIPHLNEYARGTKRFAIGLATVNSSWIAPFAHPFLKSLKLELRSESKRSVIDPSIALPPSNKFSILLSGYWQTCDHFLKNSALLKEYFRPSFTMSQDAQEWLSRIHSTQSAFIHVRRGDYLNFSGGGLRMHYYEVAAKTLESLMGPVRWHVFSDDQGWCRENLGFLGNASYVSCSSPDNDIEEIQLMAACKGGIIANSSFSWWGGALGDSPHRHILCPRNWWGSADSDYRDLRLPSWIPIDN
ncbi:glycosyl transferase family 11 [Terrimicrobium sacchariphilum]|uniref:Glycosyl transferase family 11 n=1 Tax=Terrimicrobium sacchariphilum TaxID=690879 RepID=A0A146G1P7_TERSA|nr:alpha-1,2-fucosyltransferase [Terrimicrobium sacchariphilum]GAT31755.1 glycosyl transferase family 11 [Terrimicrobium sacchariphilum]